LPEWLKGGKEGRLTEGAADGGSAGFLWRPGMQKCTEGIWIWSQPFVRTRTNADGATEKVAVLLMDTQGAWDSQLSKEDSATIFGLTSVLSSKQVYNISKQIQEDKVENLHWFVECARSAMRTHEGEDVGKAEERESPFQSLEFLVRDWPNFEDEWGMAECCEQMREHLAMHCDPEKVDTPTVKSLGTLFSDISCFCLPNPGQVIEKKTWGGALEKLDPDFITFLDTYVKRTFQTLPAKQILGQDLMPANFAIIFKAFVKAFKDAKPVAMPIAQALAFSNNLQAKERGVKTYKRRWRPS
jgi:atlastin